LAVSLHKEPKSTTKILSKIRPKKLKKVGCLRGRCGRRVRVSGCGSVVVGGSGDSGEVGRYCLTRVPAAAAASDLKWEWHFLIKLLELASLLRQQLNYVALVEGAYRREMASMRRCQRQNRSGCNW
jgi:hypothetical protein